MWTTRSERLVLWGPWRSEQNLSPSKSCQDIAVRTKVMDESTDIATSGAVPQAQKGNNEVSARGNMKEKLWTFGNEGCLTDISLQGMLHRCFQIQATSGLRGCFFITARWDQGFPQEYRSGQPIGKSSQLEGGSGPPRKMMPAKAEIWWPHPTNM